MGVFRVCPGFVASTRVRRVWALPHSCGGLLHLGSRWEKSYPSQTPQERALGSPHPQPHAPPRSDVQTLLEDKTQSPESAWLWNKSQERVT